jgi:GTP-binding protein
MGKYIEQNKIRNIAMIAHVDHGKTTLVDAFLKQSHLFRDNQEEMSMDRILDFNELEREKGITIKAKNASIRYKDYKINIIDTPGHADFGGEVERTLNLADGCLLLVDAQEGVMPQTRFVLKKAFELGLKPIVVINKIDKKLANIARTLDKINDLFLNLVTDSTQLEFPVFYAIAREGKVFSKLPEGDLTIAGSVEGDLTPLLDAIISEIAPPSGDVSGTFQMQVSSIDYNAHVGRYLIGKIKRGSLSAGESVVLLEGEEENARQQKGTVKQILVREGLDFVPVDEVQAGEVVALVGIDSTAIGATVCSPQKIEALPQIEISSPTVRIKFEANSSPFVGRDGKFVTAKQLQQRLDREASENISLEISKAETGSYFVSGRGELQLSILIETLRREGYEFQVSRPEVILKEIDGVKSEPLEELFIDIPEEYFGVVSTAVSERKGELVEVESESGQSRMIYKILTRNLFGLRARLMTETKGNLVMNSFTSEYVAYHKQEELFRKGVLVASESGTSMGYALNTIQERGSLFIGSSEEVYEGMIVGINKYGEDMDVNVCKARHKSGVRVKHDEITQTSLEPPIQITLEYALVFLAKDEILEVTPNHLRLRKLHLTKTQRDWSRRKNLADYAKKQMEGKM